MAIGQLHCWKAVCVCVCTPLELPSCAALQHLQQLCLSLLALGPLLAEQMPLAVLLLLLLLPPMVLCLLHCHPHHAHHKMGWRQQVQLQLLL